MRMKPAMEPRVMPKILKSTTGSCSAFGAPAFDVAVAFASDVVVDAISAIEGRAKRLAQYRVDSRLLTQFKA